jgi:LemA protein
MIIAGVIVGVIAIIAIMMFNNIISTRNTVLESKSAIDTVFQNRYDLIPNSVEVVKQYAGHEKNLLEDVTKIRTNAMSGQEMSSEKFQNENMLSSTLKSIFALSENYPDLKANQNFENLQNQWMEIEDRLQAARRAYNSSVKALRDLKQMFPSNIIASMMKLESFDMFEADTAARESLNAKELFNK